MSYKNINIIENKLTFLLNLINKLQKSYPERVKDLDYINAVCKRYAVDIETMKVSLDASNGHGNEADFQEMIIHIDKSLVEIKGLLEKTFKK